MTTDWLTPILLQAAEAPAAGAGGEAAPNPFSAIGNMLVPILLVCGIFYVLVLRPDAKKRKDRELQIKALKKGDTVVTTGGIIAKVWRADGPEIILVLDKDKDVKGRFARSAVFEVLKGEGLEAAADPSAEKKELEKKEGAKA